MNPTSFPELFKPAQGPQQPQETHILGVNIFTKNREQATRLASKIETGIVWINTWLARDLRTPFGGVKASGFGREGGNYALNFFTEPKNICFPENK